MNQKSLQLIGISLIKSLLIDLKRSRTTEQLSFFKSSVTSKTLTLTLQSINTTKNHRKNEITLKRRRVSLNFYQNFKRISQATAKSKVWRISEKWAKYLQIYFPCQCLNVKDLNFPWQRTNSQNIFLSFSQNRRE